MFDRIDPHPERRGAQIAEARESLRGHPDRDRLQQACAVLLALSDDPYDRTLAAELLRSAGQRPSYRLRAGGGLCEGERSDARAGGGSDIAALHSDDPHPDDPLSRIVAAAGSR